MQRHLETLRNQSIGGVIKYIKLENLSEAEIRIVSLDEQEKIINKLQKIESIINIRKQQLEKLQILVKSQFVEMFENKNYREVKLYDVCDVRDGTHDSPKYFSESPYKFITSKNLVNGKISFEDIKYISEQDYNKFNERSKVNYGDILMPMIGTIGNPVIVDIPDSKIDFAIKNVALIKFNKSNEVNNVYIKNLLMSDNFNRMLELTKKGGTQQFVALKDIRNFNIRLAPIELQNKFASFVEQIDKQEFEELKSEKLLKNLIDEGAKNVKF